jgi:hypothetical protein
METIAVLLIFFVIIFVGFTFFTRMSKSSIQEKIEERQELAKIEATQVITNLPEIQCSNDNDIKEKCVDLLKIGAAEGTINNNIEDYFYLFSYSNVTVVRIFPSASPGQKSSWNLYSMMPDEIEAKLASYFPVLIYDPMEQMYYFGYMVVEVFK